MGRPQAGPGPTQVVVRTDPLGVRNWGQSRRASPLLISMIPLAIYAFTRIVNYMMILGVADSRHISYADLVTSWDGDWYKQIATHGYPSTLPIDDNGKVLQNVWAFAPLYPVLVRGLMTVTGLTYDVAAPGLSLMTGAAAAVVMFALVSQTAGRVAGAATVALTGTFMAAPVMQLAYTESLALLLVCSALLLLRRRSYLLAGAVILLLSLTRPIVLAFLPVVLAHGMRLRQGRAGSSFSRAERRGIWGVAGACIAGGVLWPVTVAIATGSPLAWVQSESAWVTTPTVVPGLSWLRFFGDGPGWVGLSALAASAVLIVGIMIRPGAARWGLEVRTWTLSYGAYVFFVTAPVPSLFRFMLLAFPLFWPFPTASSTTRGRTFRLVLFVMLASIGVACQWVWISDFLAAVGPSKLYP